jgi:hypothetical protein
MYDKSGSDLTTLCTILSCSISSLGLCSRRGSDVADVGVPKLTDFAGIGFSAGAVTEFGCGAEGASKKEKSADAHGSFRTELVGFVTMIFCLEDVGMGGVANEPKPKAPFEFVAVIEVAVCGTRI